MSLNPAGAQHVISRLMRESLIDKQVIAGTEAKPVEPNQVPEMEL